MTGTVTSPTFAAQIADLQRQFPEMRWVHWEPLDRDTERGVDVRLFGRAVDRVYDLAQAQIVFGVESDLISTAPGALAYARQFAASRRPYDTGGRMSRVYAIESTPTLLGAKADHRLALPPAEIASALRYIAGAVGAGPREWTQSETGRTAWLAAAARGPDRASRRASSSMPEASSRTKCTCWSMRSTARWGPSERRSG